MANAAPAIMAITAVIGAGTAAYSAKQQFDAADDAEKIAKKNAELSELETEEEARRLERSQERVSDLAKAKAAASGVGGETVDLYLADIEDTQAEELNWLKRTGARRADILRDEGEIAKSQGRAGAFGSIGEGFSYAPSIYSGGRKAKWWK